MAIKFKIAEIRDAKGLSQFDVSRETGIPYTNYVKYDRGLIKNPSLEVLSQLCEFFQVNIGDLMTYEKPEN